MLESRLNNLIKGLSKKVLVGLIFGIAAVAGIALVLSFTEPTSGPTGFREPADTQDKGDWLAYGRGWIPNATGSGSTLLTEAACDDAADWYWFEDGNGDGDTTDEEDGICVKATTVTSSNWGGTEISDNTYIAAYTCSGNFPNGTSTATSCALCVADCYDGKKDLPNQGGYTAPEAGEAGFNGPITPEVLKDWKGTRLPTLNDFFGFCGATDGDANASTGDSNYHSSGASADTTIGKQGGNVGRGISSEYMDLSNCGNYEWLSELDSYRDAMMMGVLSCSYLTSAFVITNRNLRAVFRP